MVRGMRMKSSKGILNCQYKCCDDFPGDSYRYSSLSHFDFLQECFFMLLVLCSIIDVDTRTMTSAGCGRSLI